MLELSNHTAFAAERSILRDVEARQVWVVAVKATFAFGLDGEVRLAAQQEPVALSPICHGDPTRTSLRRDAEIAFAHPGTDVVVNGTAYAPGRVPVTSLDVAVQLGDLKSAVRVFGDRVWHQGVAGLKKSAPSPFSTMPLRYERAFGGVDETSSFDDNPVGVGFFTSAARAKHAALPNVEDPSSPIDDWSDRRRPAGFGAIAAHWGSRRAFAGTYDASWQTLRAPLWPSDLDLRHFSCAAAGLWSPRPLRGGEQVMLVNLHPERPVISFRVPRLEVVVHTFFGQHRLRQRVQLDRILIEPDDGRLVLQWRSSLICARDPRAITRSVITTKRVLQWT